MKTPIRSLSTVAVGLALAFGAPSLARAGGTIITAHKLTISLHSATEITNSSNDDKTDKTDAKQSDIFEKCVGSKPTKTQGVYLFLSNSNPSPTVCSTPPISAKILAIDTSPLTQMATVGTVEFGDPLIQNTTGHGVTLKTIKVPATVHINCNNLGVTTAELNGILNLSYQQFSKGGAVCPISGSIKPTGSAADGSTDIVIDDGSIIKINTRDGGISTLPPVL